MVPIQDGGGVQRLGRLRVVDGDLAVRPDDRAAAEAGDPFQRVAGQPLIGPALEDEAEEAVVAGFALALLDGLGGLGQLGPGPGHLELVFVQQVLAVVQQPGIGIPGQGQQLAVAGQALDDVREILVDGGLVDILLQVDEVAAEDAGPDHVDLEHVDVAGLAGEELLVEGELFRGRLRGGDDLDGVAGLGRPGFGRLVAQPGLNAGRAAGEGDLGAEGSRSCRHGEGKSGESGQVLPGHGSSCGLDERILASAAIVFRLVA